MSAVRIELEIDERPGRTPEDVHAFLDFEEGRDPTVEISVGERSFRVTLPRMAFVDHFAREAREKQKKNIDQIPAEVVLGVQRTPHNPYRLFSLYWYVWKELNLDWVPYHVGTTFAGEPCPSMPRVKRQGPNGYHCPACGKEFPTFRRIFALLYSISKSYPKDGLVDGVWVRDADRGSNTCLSPRDLQTLVSMGFLNEPTMASKWKHTLKDHRFWDDLQQVPIMETYGWLLREQT